MGRALERCRLTFLPDIGDTWRVLMLGEGDGRFLAAFLRSNPRAVVDCVDLSARMLELAGQRAGEGAGRVRFHHADAREWPLPTGVKYDLIVTHFFLDCFTTEQLAPLLVRCASAATEHARWVVSDFHQPARGFAAWRARVWIGGLYAFFRLTTGLRVRRLPMYHAALQAHGFHCERATTAEMGLLISELWRRS